MTPEFPRSTINGSGNPGPYRLMQVSVMVLFLPNRVCLEKKGNKRNWHRSGFFRVKSHVYASV